MLTQLIVGALSVFLVHAGEENPASNQVTAVDAGAESRHRSIEFFGKTWCFGQVHGETQCDFKLELPQLEAGKKPPMTQPNKPISLRFELLDRAICLGHVPADARCDFHLKAPANPEQQTEAT